MTNNQYKKYLHQGADLALTMNAGNGNVMVDQYKGMIDGHLRLGEKSLAMELLIELTWKLGFGKRIEEKEL